MSMIIKWDGRIELPSLQVKTIKREMEGGCPINLKSAQIVHQSVPIHVEQVAVLIQLLIFRATVEINSVIQTLKHGSESFHKQPPYLSSVPCSKKF